MKNHDFCVANCDKARDLRMTIWTDLEPNNLVLGPVNFSVGTLANKFNNSSKLCNDGAPDLIHWGPAAHVDFPLRLQMFRVENLCLCTVWRLGAVLGKQPDWGNLRDGFQPDGESERRFSESQPAGWNEHRAHGLDQPQVWATSRSYNITHSTSFLLP